MNAQASATRAYTQNGVLSASPGRLIVMLYDGALKFLARAEAALRAGDVPAAAVPLRRTHAILDELVGTLNPEAGEVADRLQAIYLFCSQTLLEAQLEQDPEKIAEVVKLLRDLRGAWAEIAE